MRRPGNVRLFLLHGPDEAGSRALADELAAAMGAGSERVDLAPGQLKADPARLADEAASVSLFGDARHIRVEGAGDEVTDAVAALLEANAAGNPAVVIAGTLRATSKLLKLALASPLAMAFASYPLSAQDMERLAVDEGRAQGLRIDNDVARRLATAAGGDRAILASEIGKYALFLDATPEGPVELTHEVVDALSADAGEADLNRLVAAVLSGDPRGAEAELARLAAIGTSGVPLVRAVQRRLLLLAELSGQVAAGNSIGSVLGRPGSGVYPREQEAVAQQLRRWTPARAATALERIAQAGRAAMSARGPGELAIETELGVIARNAARAR
nr:DNA polymerase III subunit delta [Sphingomonas quercus]